MTGVQTCALPISQNDLLSSLDSTSDENVVTLATFKSTRLIDMQTVESLGKRTLDVRISHRFGEFNSGGQNAYGLDGPASIRIGLEYSFDGRLMAGLGRTSYEKMFDGVLKYRLLRQTESGSMPLSVTLVSSMFITGQQDPEKSITGVDKYHYFSDRMSFCHQVIIGRKFNKNLSIQMAPTMIHENMVESFTDNNDSYHMTFAARYKFSRRIALTGEYGFSVKNYTQKEYYNHAGIGMDIETGGHVFQFFVTNSFGITENQFLIHNTSSWKDNAIRIGFNISRVFTL